MIGNRRAPAVCPLLVLAIAMSGAATEETRAAGPTDASETRVRPLADAFVAVYESPEPLRLSCGSPGLALLPGGRLVATLDLSGDGLRDQPGLKGTYRTSGHLVQGKVYTSDDRGKTWMHRTDFPFRHARPFVAGNSVYVLGEDPDLAVIRSNDGGETWSPTAHLSRNEYWHQAPSNVHYAGGYIYLVMEKLVHDDVESWPVSAFAPVLMRADVNRDLSRKESWAFATELSYRDAVREPLDYFGVPFFPSFQTKSYYPAAGRPMAPMGWLETNVVQFTDPDHYWYDSQGKTFHLWMRAHTGGTGLAAVAKVVEDDRGRLITQLETVPSGRKALFVPCPGGQMKFHIVYDGITRLFWLLSTQSTDSMTRAERLPDDRFELPNNERQRLQLHFSRNCIDWCFAGLVSKGGAPGESRHYASMVIDGDDLHVLSRSGDSRAESAHNCNLITFHTITSFRKLVY